MTQNENEQENENEYLETVCQKQKENESDDEKIAPIAMDTGRPAGRAVGMESGTGGEERDGDGLLREKE